MADDRFQTAYVDVAALFTVLNTQTDVSPQSTEEANTAAELDDTTPLVFVDYTVLPDDDTTGSFCLRSNTTDTYIAVTYSGSAGEVDLGDGECSYDTAAAAVVGDVSTDAWSVGADLMGDAVPTDLFGS